MRGVGTSVGRKRVFRAGERAKRARARKGFFEVLKSQNMLTKNRKKCVFEEGFLISNPLRKFFRGDVIMFKVCKVFSERSSIEL